jgi:hypothetical protein
MNLSTFPKIIILPKNNKIKLKKSIIINQKKHIKPQGIYSYTNEYIKFCFNEKLYNNIDPNKNDYYTYSLKKTAKIYKLKSTKNDIQNFITKYISDAGDDIIDWKKVQDDGYDGIYFYNYKKFSKNIPIWFSIIDVTTLCLWNTNVITKLQKIDL